MQQIDNKEHILPMMPLRDIVIFPGMIVPVFVGRTNSIRSIEKAMEVDRKIFISLQLDSTIDKPDENQVYKVGCLSEVLQFLRLPDGTYKVLLEGERRGLLLGFLSNENYYQVIVKEIKEELNESKDIVVLTRTCIEMFEEYISLNKKIPKETFAMISNLESSSQVCDSIAAHTLLKVKDRQEILETITLKERLQKLIEKLQAELEILKLDQKIRIEVRDRFEKAQRDYFLHEQMKVIKKELGASSDEEDEIEELRKKINGSKMPEEAKNKALKEVNRLAKMHFVSAEAGVIRTYIDWLLDLPWNVYTQDKLDIKRAQKILEEDHYGLKDPKERILEYLAIKKLSDGTKTPILCFVGPPGVGKTSLAKSIARALDRKFVRVSLGGVRDEAEIRGHRRTYVGALPGRIIQLMKKAESMNPVFLLDEVDKMSMDFRGDPSAALLEVLDPEQNIHFSDHYLEIDFDLSKVLFITTANFVDPIPRPLQDRMEIIHLPSYTEYEKFEIARRFLIPKILKDNGLSKRKVKFIDEAIYTIIKGYTREAGVRNLERELSSVVRKLAKDMVLLKGGKSKLIKITKPSIYKYLKKPRYSDADFIKDSRIGIARGLAWTEFGGEVLEVQTSVFEGKGELTLTGQLGEVMKESCYAAKSYARKEAKKYSIPRDFYNKSDMHIHVPEGAIPKDGPSAGITIATSMISALSNIPVRGDIAMTGEINLIGEVLPVGGLREKVLASLRANIKEIVVPYKNEKDVSEIPKKIQKRIIVHYVKHMDEVLNLALVKKESIG
ncbi:MAG: endopeptidase La [Candidatus Hydrogenedentota bacterium]